MNKIVLDLKSKTSYTVSLILLTIGLTMSIASYTIGNTAHAAGWCNSFDTGCSCVTTDFVCMAGGCIEREYPTCIGEIGNCQGSTLNYNTCSFLFCSTICGFW